MVRDTPSSQDVSTHQIWNSYLKEYRRYAPDTKRDGRTDGRTDSAITICLQKFLDISTDDYQETQHRVFWYLAVLISNFNPHTVIRMYAVHKVYIG